jgi:hypothetical protein
MLHVRFGSKADVHAAKSYVCFTPESGHRSIELIAIALWKFTVDNRAVPASEEIFLDNPTLR